MDWGVYTRVVGVPGLYLDVETPLAPGIRPHLCVSVVCVGVCGGVALRSHTP